MRFMMLMIPRIYQPDILQEEKLGEEFIPSADAIAKMEKFNEELEDEGALISLDGLHPISKGARVEFPNGMPKVTDGPSIKAKEVLGGYWIIDVKSKEEAVEWAKKVPAEDGDVIEVRQIFEISE